MRGIGVAPRTAAALAAAFAMALAALAATGCSTAPKAKTAVYAERNRAASISRQGDSRFMSGNYADAISFYRQALEIGIAIDYDEGVVVSRNAIGRTYAASGKTADAVGEYRKALELAERIGDGGLIAQSLVLLAEADIDSGEEAEALAKLERALALAAPNGATRALALHARGRAKRAGGDADAALRDVTEAAAINKALGLLGEYASDSYLLSSIHSRAGNAEKALEYALEALAADKEAENSPGIASDYYALGKIALKAGKDDDAWFYLRKSLDIALVRDMAAEALRALDELVPLAGRMKKTEEAADFADMAGRIRATTGKDY
jgi:tetratricopeptide (TPR) repeat protein